MSLKDLHIEKEYRNLQCDVIRDFYLPVLKEAVLYKRAVGFFNSAALYEMATGLDQLVQNNGTIQLIVSPQLNEEDIRSIQLGYELREIIAKCLVNAIEEPKTILERNKLNLLANLIADNVLDIKVAFKVDSDSAGVFHEKIGIINDKEGNGIAFTGSMNETYSGLLLNYESIDVFCSWRDEDKERVQIKDTAFDRLWNNCDKSIEVVDFPQVAIEKLNRYKTTDTEQALKAVITSQTDEKPKNVFFRLPKSVELFDYQNEAIDSWLRHGGRGIFDMATGTGKTYTALGALSALSEKLKDNLAVLIVCPYQHLVEQWVEDIKAFGVDPLICYSRYDWKNKFRDNVLDYNLGVIKNFCAITTNATYILDSMQSEINKVKKNFCIVVDEAHNFGAKKQIECMNDRFKYRLALSATLERHHDDFGTKQLYQYFGEKCITYTLKEAIDSHKLTPYFYHIVPVALEEDELEEYVDITDKVANILKRVPIGSDIPDSAERLLIKRARLIAGAKNKVVALRNIIKDYKDKNHLLVYCGATRVPGYYYKHDNNEASEEEVRQIDDVTALLGNELGMSVTQFTAAEDSKEREIIKSKYVRGQTQALVAIRCLDEGMNIPGIEVAFILASSTNPKEYIQRRGRVLRKAENKNFAVIYDFVTIPRPIEAMSYPSTIQAELSLVKREIERMRDFQELSENPSEVTDFIRLLTDKYNLYGIGESYDRI